jgi:hypothetical protein
MFNNNSFADSFSSVAANAATSSCDAYNYALGAAVAVPFFVIMYIVLSPFIVLSRLINKKYIFSDKSKGFITAV